MSLFNEGKRFTPSHPFPGPPSIVRVFLMGHPTALSTVAQAVGPCHKTHGLTTSFPMSAG